MLSGKDPEEVTGDQGAEIGEEDRQGKGPALYEDVGQGKVWSVGAMSDVAACRTQYLEGRKDVRGAG